MPLFNWNRCLEGKLNYCRIIPSISEPNEADLIAFQQIENEYLDNFPPTGEHLQIMQFQAKIAQAQADFILTGRRFYLNPINYYQKELDNLRKIIAGKTNQTTGETLILLSKFIGYSLSEKTITVKQFFDSINLYNKSAA